MINMHISWCTQKRENLKCCTNIEIDKPVKNADPS